MVKEITNDIVEYVDEHLTDRSVRLNLRTIYEKHGTVSHEYTTIIPTGQKIRAHTHFYEGLLIRGQMRSCSLCNGWSMKDIMKMWPIVAEVLIGVREV